ncbi:hypothetical protein [Rhizorhabdus argentea]|uniref:hypothetical protein n=1 Tax=Rhizorhabdus argentea TaxID=1387174 RepID=UPI0030EBD004
MTPRASAALAFLAIPILAVPLPAATPRQILTEAAFQSRDRASALSLIAEADRGAAALLARDASNHEAALVRAMALGYRAKLTRSRADAMAARRLFERFAAADPRDPDAAAAIGAWHLDSVIALGGLVAGMAIGAKKSTGLAMMDRAVALGGNRALFPGLAALLRLSIDPADPRGRALAETASTAAVVVPIDRIMQRSAAALLVPLRSGDRGATQALAKQLLPFGRLKR